MSKFLGKREMTREKNKGENGKGEPTARRLPAFRNARCVQKARSNLSMNKQVLNAVMKKCG